MDQEEIRQRLQEEFGYPPQGAKVVATKLSVLVSPICEAFSEWWYSGAIPALEVQGYTVQRLADEQGLTPIAAFLTLDWLQREPDKALPIVKRGPERVRFRAK